MQSLNPATLRISAVAALLLLSACQGCQTPESGLPLLQAEAAQVEFGKVAVGERKTLPVVLRNAGRAPLHLASAALVGESAGFEVEAAEGVEIAAGATAVVRAGFAPLAPGRSGAVLRVSAVEAVQPVDVVLTGEGVLAACTVSATHLDFGTVAQGETARASLTLQNHSDAKLTLSVSALTGDAAFYFDEGSAAGSVEIAPQSARSVGFAFHPARPGSFAATLALSSVDGCSGVVLLEGRAVEEAIVASPTALDFGFVNLGGRIVRTIELRNQTTTTLTLDELEIDGEAFALGTAAPVTMDSASSVQLPLAFTPAALGPFAGTLRFSSHGRALSGHVALRGTGGGPAIELSPTVIDLGEVALGAFRDAVVTVTNTGVDVPGTDEDDLSFGTPDARGQSTGPEASLAGGSDFGLVTALKGQHVRAGESLDLRIRFQPKGMGAQSAVVHVFSNDAAHPERLVTVKATGTAMPYCDYEVRPGALDYGRVSPGEYLDRSFVVTNRSARPGDDCRLWLEPPSRSPFALVNGPMRAGLLKAGESMRVPVRFFPNASGLYEADLELYASSAQAPRRVIAVSGDAGPSCLRFAPRQLDFGATPVSCSSKDRTITVVNDCETAVPIAGVSVGDGSAATPFQAVLRPALPYTLRGYETLDIPIRYRPIDAGPHEGMLVVQEGTSQASHVVPLIGHGGSFAEETFAANPKVDVLVIADETASFFPELQQLFGRFPYFMSASTALDYRVGITSTSVCAAYPTCTASEQGYANGRLLPLGSSAEKALIPTSPRPEQVWKDDLQVLMQGGGGKEHLLDVVRLALDVPRNAGIGALLRQDSLLSVVFLSDAAERSPRSDDYFAGFLGSLRPGLNDVIVSGAVQVGVPGVGSGGPIVVGTNDDCPLLALGQGERLLTSFIDRFGGVAEDVCTTDWNASLNRLSFGAFGWRTRFELKGAVDPAGLTVELNGAPATGWTYLAADHAIHFNRSSPVAPTDTLVVRYPVACLP